MLNEFFFWKTFSYSVTLNNFCADCILKISCYCPRATSQPRPSYISVVWFFKANQICIIFRIKSFIVIDKCSLLYKRKFTWIVSAALFQMLHSKVWILLHLCVCFVLYITNHAYFVHFLRCCVFRIRLVLLLISQGPGSHFNTAWR